MTEMGYRFTFTVFSPSYNRADTLPRLYKSLCEQTFKDFEWVIVDDGSTDSTADVVKPWVSSAPFPVRYFWKPNGGKHTAINRGVQEAAGRLFAMSDADDWYVPDALERFWHHWASIPVCRREEFSGVCGLFKYESGSIVGSGLPQEVLDADDLDLRYKYRVDGDLISIKRIEVMREFPFPEELAGPGAVLCEDLVWNRMGRKYLTRFVNQVFAFKVYLEGGLTDRAQIVNLRAPMGNWLFCQEVLCAGKRFPLDVKIKMCANYIRHGFHAHVPLREQAREVPCRIALWFCLPMGAVLYLRDWVRVLMERRSVGIRGGGPQE